MRLNIAGGVQLNVFVLTMYNIICLLYDRFRFMCISKCARNRLIDVLVPWNGMMRRVFDFSAPFDVCPAVRNY